MRTSMLPVVLAVLAMVGAGCGDGGTSVSGGAAPSSTASSPPAAARYTTTTTVLESPDHGPQLCLGVVMESYPPQCSGPDVIGWDWDEVDAKESASGTTWGEYTVVGTWDGGAFTLTEPPRPAEPPGEPPDEGPRGTPCPPPEGGWQVVDPASASDEALQAAIGYARAQPDVGGVWVDQSINPASEDPTTGEMAMNDPTKLVLNVSFTGDLDRHGTAIRELWGGALCVSPAARSSAELKEIQAQLHAELEGAPSSWIDEVEGQVHLSVTVDDGLQQRLDERYGSGVVVVQPWLRPVEEG